MPQMRTETDESSCYMCREPITVAHHTILPVLNLALNIVTELQLPFLYFARNRANCGMLFQQLANWPFRNGTLAGLFEMPDSGFLPTSGESHQGSIYLIFPNQGLNL